MAQTMTLADPTPEDLAAANRLWEDLGRVSGAAHGVRVIARAIAKARAEERERCRDLLMAHNAGWFVNEIDRVACLGWLK